MKSFLSRAMLVIFALIVLFLSLVLMVFGVFLTPFDVVMSALRGNFLLQLIVVAAGAVMALYSVWAVSAVVGRKKRAVSSVTVTNTGSGQVRISVPALDSLVKTALSDVPGVIDMKTRVVDVDEAVGVHIDLTISPDTHVADVTLLMQRSVKSFLEEYAGISVKEVNVFVDAVASGQEQTRLIEAGHGDRYRAVAAPPDVKPSGEAHAEPVAVMPEDVIASDKPGKPEKHGWFGRLKRERQEETEAYQPDRVSADEAVSGLGGAYSDDAQAWQDDAEAWEDHAQTPPGDTQAQPGEFPHEAADSSTEADDISPEDADSMITLNNALGSVDDTAN